MREEVNLRSWESFLRRLADLKATHGNLLFRGQGNSRWLLQTTLERRGQTAMRVEDYYRLVAGRVKPQVESFTGRTFEVPPFFEMHKLFADYDQFSREKFPTEVFTYLVYARHHGFPSPLLDWSRSPYVAAFFAFHSESPSVTKRSIYAWSPARMRAGGTNTAELHQVGPFLKTHPRHVLQQCDYSMRVTFYTSDKHWEFTPHEDAFGGGGPTAEYLVKFNLPSRERLKVLKHLDEFNLNAYSLFGSEDSLMDTMALRELELHSMPALPVRVKIKTKLKTKARVRMKAKS